MGAKLSKKKKGYCLGAGKDGESTDTTEVEQKETETGQKDAAEPHGEKTPTDQTLNNGASEEQKVEKPNSTEVPSGETTKDNLKKDQKSESKPSAEQETVEEPNQEQDKPGPTESSNTPQQTAAEDGKVKSQPEEKPQTDHDKEKESVAKEKPTQEVKPVTEQGSSEPRQQDQSVTEPSAPALEQKDMEKVVPDPEAKMKVEKMEKEQVSVPTTEQATKDPTPVCVKEPEKASEISEATLVKPVVSITAPVAEDLEPEPAKKLVEPEPTNKVVPETPEVSLQETVQATELVESNHDLALVTDSIPVAESVKPEVSEEPVAPIPEVKIVEPVASPEPEPVSETKQETESVPEPLPSNEVPDSTALVEENVKNPEALGRVDFVTEMVEIQAATTESAPSAEENPNRDATASENCPSEQAVEEKQESKEQEVGDKEVQHDVKEESVSDKQSTEHGSLEKMDHKDTEEVALDTSKNESDGVYSEDTTVHPASQDKPSEDKTENHEMPAEELSHEPSAPLIVDKHGVQNGLPVKEEVKVHLENGCDKGLLELSGQGECREIEVCNE